MDHAEGININGARNGTEFPSPQKKGGGERIYRATEGHLPPHTSSNPPPSLGFHRGGTPLSPYTPPGGKTSHVALKNSVFREKEEKRSLDMKHALSPKMLMRKLSPGKKGTLRSFKHHIQRIEVDYKSKLNTESGAMSSVHPAIVKTDKHPGGVPAVCVFLRNSIHEVPFDVEKVADNINKLQNAIGKFAPKVYQIDIHRATARPRVVMERLYKIPQLKYKDRVELAKRFIKMFHMMRKGGVLHGDLKGINLMCRKGVPTRPVLIDLTGVQTLSDYESIADSEQLLKALKQFDEATGELNPPGFYKKLERLKQWAEHENSPKKLAVIKKNFIELVQQKERCNAACAVYEIIFGIESVPGAPVEGMIQKQLDVRAIAETISEEGGLPEDIKDFLKQGFS